MISSRHDGTPVMGLHDFLSFAYDATAIASLVQKHLAYSRQNVAQCLPIGAHLAKDDRLVVTYRVALASNEHTRSNWVPVQIHFTQQSGGEAARRYRAVAVPRTYGLVPQLRRYFQKLSANTFIAAFPADIGLDRIGRLLRPDNLLAACNEALASEVESPWRSAESQVIGYRAERRVVFAMNVCREDASGRIALKIFRPNDAARSWHRATMIRTVLSGADFVVWPAGISVDHGAIAYSWCHGLSLHDLLESGTATASHWKDTGAMLRVFHDSLRSEPSTDNLPSFTAHDEMTILDRWRRFLKAGGMEVSGSIAKYIALLSAAASSLDSRDVLLHRDFYPKQVIIRQETGQPAILDLDLAARGPAMLDIGNFLAHLLLAERAAPSQRKAYRQEFLKGYGVTAEDERAINFFELSSVLRLVALATVGARPGTLVPLLMNRARKLARSLQCPG